MNFNAQQQTFIDDLVSRTYTKAYTKAATAAVTARTIELEAQLSLAREKARDSELKAFAGQHGAHNPSDVAFLLRDSVKIADDGELHVIGKDGERRYDRSGNPLTIEGAVADFLSENTHFVRAATPSTGSGGGFFAGIFGK